MLNAIYLNALRNDEFIQLFRDITGLLAKFDVGKLRIEDEANAIKEALQELDDLFGAYSRGSAHTQAMAMVDADRDKAITGLKMVVSGFLYHFDAKKAHAANLLYNQINKYGTNIARLNYEAETTVLKNLADDFEQMADLRKSINILGLGDWVEYMKQKNEEFGNNYQKRIDNLAEGSNEALMTIRPKAREIYKRLETKVTAGQVIMNTPEHEKLIKKMNILADRYNNIPKLRKSKTRTDDNGNAVEINDLTTGTESISV